MRRILNAFGRGLRGGLVAIGALAFSGGVIAVANYTATVGAGTNFGSVAIAGVNFASQLICDFTTANQCAAVKAASTAAAATDPAMVVAVSPNNTVAVTESGTFTVTPATVGNGTSAAAARVTLSNDSTGQVALAAGSASIGTVQPGNTANTTPWLATVNQGGNSAVVKAASTAAAAADPSLVINESPNSQISAATGVAGAAHTCATGAPQTIVGCLGQIDDDVKATGNVVIVPSASAATAGTTAVAGSGVSNLIAKASAGNLNNAYVVSSAAGWVFIQNATVLQTGALTAGIAANNYQDCVELVKANTNWVATINYNPGPWEIFTTGIVIGISSTACPTFTAASTSVHIHAQVN